MKLDTNYHKTMFPQCLRTHLHHIFVVAVDLCDFADGFVPNGRPWQGGLNRFFAGRLTGRLGSHNAHGDPRENNGISIHINQIYNTVTQYITVLSQFVSWLVLLSFLLTAIGQPVNYDIPRPSHLIFLSLALAQLRAWVRSWQLLYYVCVIL